VIKELLAVDHLGWELGGTESRVARRMCRLQLHTDAEHERRDAQREAR
jgi:hypothetical protein